MHKPMSSLNGRRRRPTVPDQQRRRVRKACLLCRANKLKCDGLSPCQRCQTTKTECRFTDSVSHQSTASPQLSDRVALLEAILRSRNIKVPDDVDLSCRNPERPEEGSEYDDASRYDGSIIIDCVPTPQTYVHDQGKTHFDGSSSAWAFFDSVREAVDKPSLQQRRRQTAYRHFILDSPTTVTHDMRTSLLAALPPREVLDFLSTTFFRYCQSNYFFVHPAIFSRKLDAFLSGTNEFGPHGNNTTRRPLEFICILFMVLAIGSQYADLEQRKDLEGDLSVFMEGSTTPEPAPLPTPSPKANPGWQFYRVSQRFLSEVVSTCSMTSIQACVLQGTFLVTTSAHDIAYNVFGLAMRMAVNMGMHRAVNADLHPQIQELRNRLWWSVYTHERQLTFQLGRPLMLDDEEIDASFPQDMPELRISEYTSSVPGQVALIKLCKIMGRIVKCLYSRNSPNAGQQVIDTKTFAQLKAALQGWRTNLPEVLQITSASTRGTVHLHLTYEQAVMLLSRIPLSYAASLKHQHANQADQQHKIKFLQDATRDCIQAALETIKMLKMLKERHLLCRYSCQDPLYCSSALHVLLLGARLETPAENTKRTILDGINVLRELATGSETAASSLGRVVAGFEPFFKTELEPATRSKSPRECGHRAWQAWMSGQAPTSFDNGIMVDSDVAESISPMINHIAEEQATPYGRPPQQEVEAEDMTATTSLTQHTDIGTHVVSPDYGQSIPNDLLNGWMVDGQASWLSDLNNNLDVLGHSLMTSTTDDLSIWDMMPSTLDTEQILPASDTENV